MDEIINKFAMELQKDIKNTIISLAKRYNLNEKEAINYIMRENEINEGVKRGRPKKENGEEEKREKGPRGRPPKEEKIVTMHVGDDLITRLLNQAKRNAIK